MSNKYLDFVKRVTGDAKIIPSQVEDLKIAIKNKGLKSDSTKYAIGALAKNKAVQAGAVGAGVGAAGIALGGREKQANILGKIFTKSTPRVGQVAPKGGIILDSAPSMARPKHAPANHEELMKRPAAKLESHRLDLLGLNKKANVADLLKEAGFGSRMLAGGKFMWRGIKSDAGKVGDQLGNVRAAYRDNKGFFNNGTMSTVKALGQNKAVRAGAAVAGAGIVGGAMLRNGQQKQAAENKYLKKSAGLFGMGRQFAAAPVAPLPKPNITLGIRG